MLLLGLADSLRGPLFPDLLAAFHLDNSVGSLFFSVSSAMTLPGGYLAGRILAQKGQKPALLLATALLAFSLAGYAFAPQFSILMFFVVIFGIALGMSGVAQNVMVIESAPAGRLQQFQSGLHTCYGLASFLAPLAVTYLQRATGKWQSPFLLACLLHGFLLLVLVFAPFGRTHKVGSQSDLSQEPLKERRTTYYFAILAACYVALEIQYSTRIVQFVRSEGHWSAESANLLNTLYFAAMFAGRGIFIFWRPRLRISLQMALSLAAGLLAGVAGVWLHPYFLAAVGICVAPFYPLSMTLMGKIFPRQVGHVASTMIALTGATVVMMQSLFGLLADFFSLPIAMSVGTAFGLIALWMLLRLPKRIGLRRFAELP